MSVHPRLRDKRISLQAPTPRNKDPDIQLLIQRYSERMEQKTAPVTQQEDHVKIKTRKNVEAIVRTID